MQLQVNFRGLIPEDALEKRVRSLAAKLQREIPAVSGLRLVVDRKSREGDSGGDFVLSLDIMVDHEHVKLERACSGAALAVIGRVFDEARSAVQEHLRARRMRGVIHEPS